MVVTHRHTIINRVRWQLYLLTTSSHTTEVRPTMRIIRYTLLASIALLMFSVSATQSHAQINISIGAEPSCPYGYYDFAPYNCAPYGYYGPEWFVGGRFVGAGHWFHGPANFHGHVNNAYDPRHGYKGPMPSHGPAQQHPDNFKSFHATETHDSGGHPVPEDHGHR